mgnify:CR=1 FL=1
MTTVKDYDKEAKDLLDKMGVEMKAVFVAYDKYFPSDKEPRDIYDCTFIRKPNILCVRFGQSVHNSQNPRYAKLFAEYTHSASELGYVREGYKASTKLIADRANVARRCGLHAPPEPKKPTEYDLICCIQKTDPGTFNEFCSEYDYNNDSIKDFQLYQRVCDEWERVRKFFTSEELKLLQEVN